MKLEIFQVDAFTSKPFAGNPAAVVPLISWLPDETMLAIAAENNLAETAFFVKNGDSYEISSRPSDAIALAVRVEAPIYAEDSVLDRAGVVLDEDGQPAESLGPDGQRRELDPAELERLGAFKDFIEGLDLDDFDTRKR